jgi:hypothetical protein
MNPSKPFRGKMKAAGLVWAACAATLLSGCPEQRERPDVGNLAPIPASSVDAIFEVSRAQAVANGTDVVELVIKLSRRASGSTSSQPLAGVFVTFASTSPGVLITNPAFATDATGRAAGTIRATQPGDKTITVSFSSNGQRVDLTATQRVTFTPTTVVPTKLVFTVQPSNVVAGAPIAPAIQVALQDAAGNVATTVTAPITIAIANNPRGGTLSGTRTMSTVNGVATFSDLTIDKSGVAYTLAASSSSLTGATSSAFNVSAAAPAALVLTSEPTDTEAGLTIFPDVVVEARDAFGNHTPAFTGNVTITLVASGTAPPLMGTSSKNASNGSASFDDLVVEKAGVYSLLATSTGLTPAPSAAFEVFPGDVDHLTLTGAPTSVVAGTEFALTVTARDRFENLVTAYFGTVHFSSTDAQAVLPADYGFLLTDAGTRTFEHLQLRTVGSQAQTIVVTDTVLGSVRAEAHILVTPAAASKLVYAVHPANVNVRTPFATAVRVAVQDPFNNAATASTAAITIAASPASGALSGTSTVNATAGTGIATFGDLSLANEGTYKLVASSPGLASADSNNFVVTDNVAPAAPSTFEGIALDSFRVSLTWFAPGDDGDNGTLAGQTASYELKITNVGASTSTTIRSTDTNGPPAPAGFGTLQSYDVTGLLPNTQYTFELVAIDAAGNRSMAAMTSDTTLPCPTGYTGNTCTDCETGYHKDPSDMSQCVDACHGPNPCTSPPAATCSGNNLISATLSTGLCSVTPPSVTVSCDYGTSSTDCTATGKVCQDGACVNQPPTFVFNPLTNPITAGVEETILVKAQRSGVTDTGYLGTVTLTSNDPAAVIKTSASGGNFVSMPVNYTFTSGDAGETTFVIQFRTAGASRTFRVADSVLTSFFEEKTTTVDPAAASQLTFDVQPANVNVRVPFANPIKLAVRDAFGNAVTTGTFTVKVEVGATSGTAFSSASTTTQNTDSNGVATFGDLSFINEYTNLTLKGSVPAEAGIPEKFSNEFTITDNLAPNPISGFSVDTLNATRFSLTLNWTAPGDDVGHDESLGATSSYKLVYGKTSFNDEAGFNAQTLEKALGAPQGKGFPESTLIENLDAGTTYFFGLRVNDGAGNLVYAFTSGATNPCDTGYSGPQCDSCADGYADTDPSPTVTVCVPVCDTVTCNTPTTDFCTGTVATRHSATGSCTPTGVGAGFTCNYDPQTTDCAAGGSGQLCFGAGICAANPCSPNPCNDTPAPQCEPNGVDRTTFGSQCTVGANPGAFTCAYPPTTTACAQFCEDANCVTANPPAAGQVIVTEIMATPDTLTAPKGEWFEIFNRTSEYLNITGMKVRFNDFDTADLTLVPVSPSTRILLRPNAHFVLGQSALPSENGNVPVQYAYGDDALRFLNATGGSLELSMGATALDAKLTWDSSFGGIGTSGLTTQLSSKVRGTGSFHNRNWYWCAGAAGGTPGATNTDCGVNVIAPLDFCRIQFPDSPRTVGTSEPLTVYARVYDDNVSNRNQNGNDEYPFIEVDLGYGPSTENDPRNWPTGNWTRATFNSGYVSGCSGCGFVANDDELQANLVIAAEGSYKYAFRARNLDPTTFAPGSYIYCDQTNVAADPATGTYRTVTVLQPPVVTSARTIARKKLVVTFDKDIDGTSLAADRFTVSGGITTSSATLNTNVKEVTVTVDDSTPLAAGASYTVTVANTVKGTNGVGVSTTSNTAMFTGLALCGVGSKVVISQIYVGGATSSGVYKSDYVEIHNRGATTQTLTNHSIQYQPAGNTGAWSSSNRKSLASPLALAPGEFYLVSFGSGTGGIDLSPAANDSASGFSFSATGGKVALVSATTLLSTPTGGCTSATGGVPDVAATVVDFIGYGSPNCSEGLSPVVAPSVSQAMQRGIDRCADTNVNSADYLYVNPLPTGTDPSPPRNQSSAPVICCDD